MAQQKLVHDVMCNGAHVTGILGCVALYPPNLLLNTTNRAHSVKHVKQADVARPQKAPPEVDARTLFEV